MKISILNFRRIKSAEIEPAKITLLAGRNGDGKTSILQAIAAALTGNTIPLIGLKKQDAMALVHTGAASGEITVDNKIGTSTVTYPDAKRSSEGAPLEISLTAAGMVSFVDLSTAERATFINDLMHSEPSHEDLISELEKIGASSDVLERVWQTIQAQGWDAAYKHAKEVGAKFKGGWEEITKDRYGLQKAETWVPAEWEPDLADATETALKAELDHERQWLEAAISDQAVNNAEVARLAAAAGSVAGFQKAYDDTKTELDALFTNEHDLQKALRELPASEQPRSVACPHCKGALEVRGSEVFKAKTYTAEELSARTAALKDAQDALQRVKAEITGVNAKLGLDKAKFDAANNAAKKIAEIKAKPAPSSGTETKPAVDDCRSRVAHAENRLSAWTRCNNAKVKHICIVKNQKIIEILAPEGLRLSRLKYALTEINKKLFDVAHATGWTPVEIEDDLSISFGDYQYLLQSMSMQYRIRISLQIAFTIIDQSQLVLIDGADILDSTGRNGLFKMLSGFPGKSVVAMTISKQDAVPAIDKLGGSAYWIEDGTAQKIRG
jgi:energy-coupling factor transporter ATP-binding protein EcfA2